MEQENATQQGADSGQLTPAYAARSAAMAQIAQNVHQTYAPELASFDEETGQVAQVQPQVQEPPRQEPERVEPPQAEVQAQPEPQEDLETIVVDGKPVQVKRDQLIEAGRRTLQKESAADKRLQEATEIWRNAQAYANSLRGQPSSDAGFEQSPSSDATNGSGSGAQQATPDPRALVREELWIHDATKAAQRFKEEFKDIAEDPFAARLVATLENERLTLAAQQGTDLGDPWEAYKAHGTKVREWLGKAKPASGPAVSQDRIERKRETVTVTGASARMQPPAPPKPLTTSEIIEQQRLARRSGRQLQPVRN
jgi:hypothetical protein